MKKQFFVFSFQSLLERHLRAFVPSLKTKNSKLKTNDGFTLVELLVAVTLFAIVMLISVGTLLSLTGANRKAQALQSVMNNLNVGLDSMVRSIRMGSDYYCGTGTFTGTDDSGDCPGSGKETFSFEPFNLGTPVDRWAYKFENSRIKRSKDNGLNWEIVTAPEVTIESMKFYVDGTKRGDDKQPKVVITLNGIARAADLKAATTFSIQATAVQRLLDL